MNFFDTIKVKISKFSSLGGLINFYLMNTSFQIYVIDLDKSFWNKKFSFKSVWKKYLDKYYDYIFVIGNINNN